MICYDKYGKMTPEFSKYQQAAWDDLRARAEAYTVLAIKDGVCPNAIRETMKLAIECGSVVACAKAYTEDHIKSQNEQVAFGQSLADMAKEL